MAVYVDNMKARFGRLVMCHMLADSDDELHAMAERIGVARRWWQDPANQSSRCSHYDIALSKRALAVVAGAIEITMRQAAVMNAERRRTGRLCSPAEATRIIEARWAAVSAEREAVEAALAEV